MTESDGRFFAWVRHGVCWDVPRIEPQIFYDVGMTKYLENNVNTQARLIILSRHTLMPDEYDLTVDQLAVKYPAPRVEG